MAKGEPISPAQLKLVGDLSKQLKLSDHFLNSWIVHRFNGRTDPSKLTMTMGRTLIADMIAWKDKGIPADVMRAAGQLDLFGPVNI